MRSDIVKMHVRAEERRRWCMEETVGGRKMHTCRLRIYIQKNLEAALFRVAAYSLSVCMQCSINTVSRQTMLSIR